METELTEILRESGAKPKFGLVAQGHISTIQKLESEWFPGAIYSKEFWETAGKKIGWCPFTASLHYFRYLQG